MRKKGNPCSVINLRKSCMSSKNKSKCYRRVKRKVKC